MKLNNLVETLSQPYGNRIFNNPQNATSHQLRKFAKGKDQLGKFENFYIDALRARTVYIRDLQLITFAEVLMPNDS